MTEPERQPPHALLLTAGLGTRLQPLTFLRAKAAVPINGEPLAIRVLRTLARAGIRDCVLNLHHRPASITSLVGDGSDLGLRTRYSWEQPVLGSAGGPRHALPLLADDDDDSFLIVNGDTLTNLDLRSLLVRHRESGALVTMALIENPSPQKYGGVLVSRDGWVTGFASRSRPQPGASTEASYHFIGVQAAKASAFARLEDGVPSESVNALYPELIAENPHSIAAHVSDASFLDIGTPRDYLETSLAMAEAEGPRLVGRRANIAGSALLTRTAVWDDVTIGPRARLHECIVGDAVTVPGGAHYERCVIVPAGGRRPTVGERVENDLIIQPL
jgi:NDP-sugar pyrophosphorylase family protein